MNTRLTLICGLLLLTMASTSATAYPRTGWGQPQAPRMGANDAGEMVRNGLEQLMAYLSAKPRPTPLKLAAFLEDQVASKFNFEYMTRSAMGPAYRRMSEEQRTDAIQRIEQDFLETLTRRLAGFKEQKIKFFRPRQGRGNRTSVTVGIANPGTYPTRLDFRMYRGEDGWKIYDVVANGNSAVNYYRQKVARVWARPMPYGGRM